MWTVVLTNVEQIDPNDNDGEELIHRDDIWICGVKSEEMNQHDLKVIVTKLLGIYLFDFDYSGTLTSEILIVS